MSDPTATYTFLPWLRQGIANNITSADLDPNVRTRATVPVDLTIRGEGLGGGAAPVSKQVQLYGPGDIVGIESTAIVKVEPRHWITNFEPNYLPYVEFYDEDFPWRYTPAAPAAGNRRLRPWIALVVLQEDEFDEGTNLAGRPLPFITVTDPDRSFPSAEQLWAWAHVHVNRSLADAIVAPDDQLPDVLARFQQVLDENPDLAYSRIVSPRKLAPQAAYHAFLVPTFETGRLAGLGHDPAAAPEPVHATASSWADYVGKPDQGLFPFYHRWFFRTGTLGDFEYLVRLLQPRPMDSRVGRRDLDVQEPGANLDGITDPELGGVLRLGGALQVPPSTLSDEERAEAEKYEQWDQPYPHRFQRDLAALVNLADTYVDPDSPPDPDPLITPPLYGRWHALTQRLLVERDGSDAPDRTNWVHELNLDPRWRVAAGLGTGVVQQNQETYMEAAWGQIGDVLTANQQIRQAQLAKEAAKVWHQGLVQQLQDVDAERTFVFTAPVHRVVVAGGLTLAHRTRTSTVPRAVVSAPLRRALRPRARLARELGLDGEQAPARLVQRVNRGELAAAPPKRTPPALPTTDDLADELLPGDLPGPLLGWLRRAPWLRFVPLLIALAIVLLLALLSPAPPVLYAVGLVAIAVLVYLYRRLSAWQRRISATDRLRGDGQTPDAVDELPTSPDFRVTPITDPFQPRTGGRPDSREAVRFKGALRESYALLQASSSVGAEPPRPPLDLAAGVTATVGALDPERSIPRRVLAHVRLPDRIKAQLGEVFREAMAYPELDQPMYKPLVDLGDEYFLPNMNLIQQNTISLLETNQPFIEAYMVGLNHEFARELLWREYPTDQRGSYFRQFWDVTPFLAQAGEDPEALKEKLRDIPPLDRWSRRSELGDHDHRERPGGRQEEDLVLVVRGELLKKYPTAVIYAHKAEWQTREQDGETVIDPTKPRRPVDLTDEEEQDPPRDKLKTPLYEAKVAPDIYFFGFDLTDVEARGGTGEDPRDEPGWFFVIKERPGEPRFGLDLDKTATPHFWNDLSWDDVLPDAVDGEHITVADLPDFDLTVPAGGTTEEDELRLLQHQEDVSVRWDAGTDAAHLAYILYQVPVLMAVHAAEMLPSS
jgi:hypothetical protein